MEIQEIDALRDAVAALSTLDDDAAKARVLNYLIAKFGPSKAAAITFSHGGHTQHMQPSANGDVTELPGIACLQDDGTFKLTARDLKATSTINAAIRVAHVAVLAYEQLTGEKQVSSRKVVVPALREYRAYDSNTRTALARHKGIIRKGDLLSLDAHSRQDAEQFVREILDPETHGTWTPRSAGRRRSRSRQLAVEDGA